MALILLSKIWLGVAPIAVFLAREVKASAPPRGESNIGRTTKSTKGHEGWRLRRFPAQSEDRHSCMSPVAVVSGRTLTEVSGKSGRYWIVARTVKVPWLLEVLSVAPKK